MPNTKRDQCLHCFLNCVPKLTRNCNFLDTCMQRNLCNYNEPPYSEVLGKTNDILSPSNSKMYGKELRYREFSLKHFLPVPVALVISGFHRIMFEKCLLSCRYPSLSKVIS